MKRILGIDIDGVLADWNTGFIKEIREQYPLFPENPRLDQWSWPQANGLTPEEVASVWTRIRSTKNWWMSLKRLPRTDRLKALVEIHETYFITKRISTSGLSVAVQTSKWLENKWGLDHPTVLVTRNKGPLCKVLGVTDFIDDTPEILREVRRYSDANLYVCDWPYNKDEELGQELHKIVRRVRDLNEFAEVLDE